MDKSKEWDDIVKTFKNYDIYYLSGYVKAFKKHGDGEPIMLYYHSNNCRGINVVMIRNIYDDQRFNKDINCKKLFDIITPYGYGGWLVEGNNTEELFKEYEKWCCDNEIVSEFVRFHPVLLNVNVSKKFYEVQKLGSIISMDIFTPEVIWQNLTSKNRNMIRKALKSGINIYNGRNPELYKFFSKIYNDTMDKDNADKYYYFGEDFYNSLIKDIPYNSQIFYAVLEDKIIAASIILFANKKMNYHLSGSVREYQNLAPTNLLLYEAALWGSENGYETFNLGGGVGGKEDSLFKFKKSFFRKEPLEYYVGKRIYNKEKYNELVNLRCFTDKDINFFPKYRA